MKLLPDGWPEELSFAELGSKIAAQFNEAGAREVDGRRFSPSSAYSFLSRHLPGTLGAPTDYDRFCPEEWKKLSLEDWATQYDVSKAVPSSNEEVASQLSAEVVEINEVAEDADETEDKELVEEAVAFINEKANETVYKGSVEIGNYLLEKFFDGDVAKASSKSRGKLVNYRALCQHPDLAASPGTLSVMVRVAAQEKLFEAKKLPVEKLSYSHKAELLKISDDKLKIKLFKRAVKHSFSVRGLQFEVEWEKNPDGKNKKKNKQKLNEFQRLLDSNLTYDEGWLREMDEKKRKELQRKVEVAYTQLTKLLDEYSKVRSLLSEIEKGTMAETQTS
jgi:hypothetical protein